MQGGGGGGNGGGGGPDTLLLQLAIKALQDSVKAMEARVAALEDLSGTGGLPLDNAYLLSKIAALEAMVQSAQVTATENRLFLEENFERPPPLYMGNSSV
jgi:predicted ATPase